MSYCECTDNDIEVLGNFQRIPLTDGSWTTFILFRCKSCDLLGGYPWANFHLAVQDSVGDLKKILRDHDKRRTQIISKDAND